MPPLLLQCSRFAHTVREGLSQWLGVLGHHPQQPGNLLHHGSVSLSCFILTVPKSLVPTVSRGSASVTLSAFKGSGSVRLSSTQGGADQEGSMVCAAGRAQALPRCRAHSDIHLKSCFLSSSQCKPIGNLLPEPARFSTSVNPLLAAETWVLTPVLAALLQQR